MNTLSVTDFLDYAKLVWTPSYQLSYYDPSPKTPDSRHRKLLCVLKHVSLPSTLLLHLDALIHIL